MNSFLIISEFLKFQRTTSELLDEANYIPDSENTRLVIVPLF